MAGHQAVDKRAFASTRIRTTDQCPKGEEVFLLANKNGRHARQYSIHATRDFKLGLVLQRAGLRQNGKRRQVTAQVGACRERITAAHPDDFANRQVHTAGLGADLNGILLPRDVQRAVRVVVGRKGRTPDTDGRRIRGDLVVFAVALADKPGDGAHATTEQADGESVLARIVGVGIVADIELAVRCQ